MLGNEKTMSRRALVGSAGLGLAAIASATPAAAQAPASGQAPAAAQPPTAAPKPLQDPTTKYPRPPYPRQS